MLLKPLLAICAVAVVNANTVTPTTAIITPASSSSVAATTVASSSIAAHTTISAVAVTTPSSYGVSHSSSAAVTHTPSSTPAASASHDYAYGSAPSTCDGVPEGKIICGSSSSFHICSSGLKGPVQKCAKGTVCCGKWSESCVYDSDPLCQNPNGTPTTMSYHSAPAPSMSYHSAPAPSSTYSYEATPTSESYSPSYAQACSGKEDGAIYCKSNTVFGLCNMGIPTNDVDQCCPVGTVCCPGLNRCDAVGCVGTPTKPKTTSTSYAKPTTCSEVQNGFIVCESDTSFSICQNGITTGTQKCGANTVCCPNLNRCDFAGCQAYVPPKNCCQGEKDNAVVCTSGSTLNYCKNGALSPLADQQCPKGTVCCQNLGRCDWPGCVGTSIPAPSTGYKPTLPPTKYAGPSCDGVQDGNIVCLSPNTFSQCVKGGILSSTQSCPVGTVCCQNTNRCDFPGCAANYAPAKPKAVKQTDLCKGEWDGTNVCCGDTSFVTCKGQKPASGYAQSCPSGTVCCDNLGGVCGWPGCGAYTSLTPAKAVQPTCNPKKQKHVCVGKKSYQTCDKKTSHFNRLVHFCTGDDICCAKTGKCGKEGYGCTAIKNPVSWSNRCPGQKGSCMGVADGALVCTSPNTWNYCLDQHIFAGASKTCPAGTYCCPNLGGRCEKDCSKPKSKPGSCTKKEDGETVCNGPNSYKICHNLGSLGTFECPKNQVCCAKTGKCSDATTCKTGKPKKGYKQPVNVCKGHNASSRICKEDGSRVTICQAENPVRVVPCDSHYDTGYDCKCERNPFKY